jgi:GWxTD domain-containing protein
MRKNSRIVALRVVLLQVAVLCGLLFTSSTPIFAQRYSGDYRSFFDYGEQFYNRVLQSDDGRSLDIQLDMASPMFSFLRSERQQDTKKGAYYAICDVYLEVAEKGNPQALVSKEVTDTIFVQKFEETTDKSLWHPMMQTLKLPLLDTMRQYTFRIEVRDGILAKLAVRPIINDLHLRPYHPHAMQSQDTMAIGLSDLRLFERIDHRNWTGYATALGSSYPFSRDIEGALSVVLPDSLATDLLGRAIVSVSITQLSTNADPLDTFPHERGSVTLTSGNLHYDSVYAYSHSDSLLIFYLMKPDSESRISGRRATMTFTIPGQSLDQGKYRITATFDAGGMKRTASNLFTLIWPNMPVSLADPHDAAVPLIHLMNDADYKDLMASNHTDLIKKLNIFWKKQDPTPSTAFNERMAAFYQRVDYAYFNFASQHTLDGSMTDRGKVYILYGPPSKIDRQLLPGESPIETWTYSNNVKKYFKFTDSSGRGEYRLVEMKPL